MRPGAGERSGGEIGGFGIWRADDQLAERSNFGGVFGGCAKYRKLGRDQGIQ
jgi:hypothetical protein